jgi:diacylglycerol kinase (ATP)
MKALVVLNPAAGQEAYESVRRTLGGAFKTSQIRYVVHETVKGDKPGEIVQARLPEGFDLVVAAGGDGTVSDVIDGLVGSSIPLGIIPTGTGNLIARELGIPTEVQEAIELIAGVHRTRHIDAMRIGERVFLLNVSVGVSASVIGGTTAKYKNRFGRIAYLWTFIPKLFTLKPRRLVVAVDGVAHEYHAIEVAIMNCGILAKMLYPKGPDIRIDDGHLDVLVLGVRTLRDYPRYLFGIITGRPGELLSRFIEAERDISIQSNVPLAVQADGDIIGTTPIEVELLPGAVCVFVPEEAGIDPARAPDRKAVL